MNGPTRRVRRSRTDRWIAGVCGGVAQYAGVNSTLVRLLFLVIVVISSGWAAVIYPILWLALPLEGSQAQDPVRENLDEMRRESQRWLDRAISEVRRSGLWRRR